MLRRQLLTLGAIAIAAPGAAIAQPAPQRVVRIGILGATSAAGYASRWDAMRTSLKALGYVEGRNLVIEARWADGKLDRLPELANELVGLNVDVLVTHGIPGTLAAKQATTTIPIVMALVTDPVAAGLVTSMSRPEGNVTGSAWFAPELSAKRLELLREINPRFATVGVLVNPSNPRFSQAMLQAMEATARPLNMRLERFEARGFDEFEAAFAAMAKGRIDALTVLEEAILNAHPGPISKLAEKAQLPLAGNIELAEAGGLVGYGVNIHERFQRAAFLVDRLLRGDRPRDLPIEQPSKFDLVVNIRTAAAIGVAIPKSLVLRADQVIR